MTVTNSTDTRVLDTLRDVVDKTTVGKVFGEPITQEGTIVLPVAKVGGGGGGSGAKPAEEGHEGTGAGGGFGVSAKPLGVYVLKEGKVGWRPAVDVNRVILGGQLVAVAGLLVARAVLKARAARAERLGLWEALTRRAAARGSRR